MPFNVIDSKLQVGYDIYLTTRASKRQHLRLHYVVKSTVFYPRDSIANPSNRVWEEIPNSLILMTCHLRSDGKAQTDNRVFFAQYVGLTK